MWTVRGERVAREGREWQRNTKRKEEEAGNGTANKEIK
jgi:hypothetical protein